MKSPILTKPNILLVSVLFRTPYRVLRCIVSAGGNVFVLGKEGSKSLKTSRYCKVFIPAISPIDGSLDLKLAEEINHCIHSLEIDMVIAGDTASTRSLIAIREQLNAPCFPMPELEKFDRLNNKWEFYLLCKNLTILCPNSQLFANLQELKDEIHLKGLNSPQIAKPLSMEAKKGVIKLTKETVKNNLAKIFYSPILLQDFIEGEDIGASVFCQKGQIVAFIAHTFRRYTYLAFFDQAIFDDINKIVSHLNLDGIFNFDMRRNAQGQIFYLECNPRVFWKISMSMLVGINFISVGMSDYQTNSELIKPSFQLMARFPQSVLWQVLSSPWKLNRSDFDVLKFLYRDPLPYLLEIGGLKERCP